VFLVKGQPVCGGQHLLDREQPATVALGAYRDAVNAPNHSISTLQGLEGRFDLLQWLVEIQCGCKSIPSSSTSGLYCMLCRMAAD
jgi:hypothetical protein